MTEPLGSAATSPPGEASRPRPGSNRAAARFFRDPLAITGLSILALLVVVALAAPLIAPHAPREQLYFEEGTEVCREFDPSRAHLFGVDASCRDTFSRVVHGTRISLSVGIATQAVILAIALVVGGVAGMAGGRADNLLMRFADAMYAFPDLLLIILFAAVFRETWIGDWGGGIFAIFLAVGIAGWVTLARLIRGQVLVLKAEGYVLAARAQGAGPLHIFRRHLAPNVAGPVIAALTFGIPAAILAEASLSFIGIGVRPPTPSWGTMVDEGYDLILASYWPVISFPAGAIALTMLGFTLLGDALRDALDPRGWR